MKYIDSSRYRLTQILDIIFGITKCDINPGNDTRFAELDVQAKGVKREKYVLYIEHKIH